MYDDFKKQFIKMWTILWELDRVTMSIVDQILWFIEKSDHNESKPSDIFQQ